jgi:hypothetical protein
MTVGTAYGSLIAPPAMLYARYKVLVSLPPVLVPSANGATGPKGNITHLPPLREI